MIVIGYKAVGFKTRNMSWIVWTRMQDHSLIKQRLFFYVTRLFIFV